MSTSLFWKNQKEFLGKVHFIFWTQVKMEVGFSLCLYYIANKGYFSWSKDIQLSSAGYKIRGSIMWTGI